MCRLAVRRCHPRPPSTLAVRVSLVHGSMTDATSGNLGGRLRLGLPNDLVEYLPAFLVNSAFDETTVVRSLA